MFGFFIWYYMDNFKKKFNRLVLKEKTINDLGYDPLKLSNGSGKTVWHRCDVCGEEKLSLIRKLLKGEMWAHIQCKTIKFNRTCLEKYGIDHPSKLDEVKKKRRKL